MIFEVKGIPGIQDGTKLNFRSYILREEIDMKIQFVENEFRVIKDDVILKQFPLKEWEMEYDALGKIQAIDYIKEKCGLVVFDYNDCYEKMRYRK